MILQWSCSDVKGTITFPLAYKSGYSFVWQQVNGGSNDSNTLVFWVSILICVSNKSLSSIYITDPGFGVPVTVMWIAVGY